MKKVLVIAEAGVNHNGCADRACQMVEVAHDAGADIVKFQTFSSTALVHPSVQMASYQKANLGSVDISQQEMLKQLELGKDAHKRVQELCQKLGISFLSTPFDLGSLEYLASLGLSRVKIGSGDLLNTPLLIQAGRRFDQIIISTGMSTIEEVRSALAFLAFGALRSDDPGSLKEVLAFVEERREEVQAWLVSHIILLHCVSEYPTAPERVNLRAMGRLLEETGVPVGLSDHSVSTVLPAVAVGMGAEVIEKHFTLSKDLPGPDHRASLEPHELVEMVANIREAELALGNPKKQPTEQEQAIRALVCKRLVAACDIAIGSKFSSDNVKTMRASSGADALRYFDYIGRCAERSYAPLEPIE